jgi:hypothetical protein
VVTKTSTAALADITVGTCVVATGQKNAAGTIVAATVRISPKSASGCSAGGGFGGPNPGANATPRPGATPRPTPSGLANVGFASGQVTAVSGTSVTVLTAAGTSQVVAIPTTASVTDSAVVTAAALQTGQCIRATGAKDSAGNVQATALTITPAGPSGTCTAGPGGRRGVGGGFASPAAGG